MKFNTKEHYELVLRQVFKLYDHKNRTSPREVRRKEMEYKLLKAILNKMSPPPGDVNKELSLEVKFNRQELRALQALCTHGRNLLNTHIVPGYEERMKKEEKEENKKKYQEYLDRAVVTDTLYAELLSSIESCL